jgi:hypothetical protein
MPRAEKPSIRTGGKWTLSTNSLRDRIRTSRGSSRLSARISRLMSSGDHGASGRARRADPGRRWRTSGKRTFHAQAAAADKDLVGGRVSSEPTTAVEIRAGTLAIPLDTLEVVELTPRVFETHKLLILARGTGALRRDGEISTGCVARRTAAAAAVSARNARNPASNVRAIGIALRDRVSSRFVAYAVGNALEGHDEEGVHADPHFGENNTFYLQAMATSPTVQNDIELENYLLESLRTRAIEAGFAFFSTLIEERLRDTSPS